jgi:asparagine synthase (glutamine-hydrolysing)
MPQVFRAKSLLTNLATETGDAYFNSMSTFRNEGLNRVLSPELRDALGGYTPRQIFHDRFQKVRHLGPLEQMQAVDLETYLPGDILVKADRTTMAHSLEGRSPWLDYRMVELAASLPTEFKLRQKQGKYIFKHALRRFIPAKISQRRKMGFSVPLADWLRTSLRPTFEEAVFEPGMSEYLSFPEVSRIWAEHQSGLHNHDRKLWNLLMLACWRAQHLTKTGETPWLSAVLA